MQQFLLYKIKSQAPVQTHSLDLIGSFSFSDWDGIGGKVKDCHLGMFLFAHSRLVDPTLLTTNS